MRCSLTGVTSNPCFLVACAADEPAAAAARGILSAAPNKHNRKRSGITCESALPFLVCAFLFCWAFFFHLVANLARTLSVLEFPWCSWLSRAPHTRKVSGSNPDGNTCFFFFFCLFWSCTFSRNNTGRSQCCQRGLVGL